MPKISQKATTALPSIQDYRASWLTFFSKVIFLPALMVCHLPPLSPSYPRPFMPLFFPGGSREVTSVLAA